MRTILLSWVHPLLPLLLLHKLHDLRQFEFHEKLQVHPKLAVQPVEFKSEYICGKRDFGDSPAQADPPPHKYHLPSPVTPVITLAHRPDHRGRSCPRYLARYRLESFAKEIISHCQCFAHNCSMNTEFTYSYANVNDPLLLK